MGAVSAFGKIASLGDFIRIGAPAGVVDPWDRWLQQTLEAARAACGTDWQACYLSAPIWRFVLGPGLAGSQAVAGIMMASVDRVGRQFPLTLFAILPGTGSSPSDTWFADLEDVALDTLDDAASLGTLRAALARVAAAVPGPDPVPASGHSLWVAQWEGAVQRLAFAGLPPPYAAALLFAPARWRATAPQEVRT